MGSSPTLVYLSGAAYPYPSQHVAISSFLGKSYTKVLDVGQNLIIESEVIAGNDIDAGILLNVPMLETESFGLAKEFSLRELTTPVSFGGFLQVTVDSHARETEDRSVIEM
jgi:hypothetical protein